MTNDAAEPHDAERATDAERTTSAERAAAAEREAGAGPGDGGVGRPGPRSLARAGWALAPAVALALVGGWAGTFDGGAAASGAATLHAVLLIAALAVAGSWRDPLRLGRRGRFLPPALWVLAAASCWASPVPRAGWVAVVTLPAWLLLPATLERAWGGLRRGRLGLVAVAAVVLGISLVALAGLVWPGDARAAAPLGHHNLLAVWLLAVLPLAMLPWRRGGGSRLLAGAATVAALAALLATRSLSGVAGLAAMALLVALAALVRRHPGRGTRRQARLRAVAALLAAVALVAYSAPRLARLAAGDDTSLAARWTYWSAGLAALPERPFVGHGPGSVAWTVGDWLRPVPGVNPPGEVVGDLHSLPLQLLYELGGTGALLVAAVAVLFVWRRLVARPGAEDPALVAAGLLGLAGAAVACLAVAPLAVPAVPFALALAAGAALAGEGDGEGPAHHHLPRAGALPVVVYALVAAPLLARLDLAQWHYDRSIAAPDAAAVRELTAAVHLDPAFPLYRTHLARLTARAGAGAAERAAAAREALAAAEQADGVAALWLVAGDLAVRAGEGWSGIALERACRLDPLDAPAPFLLARIAPAAPGAPAAAGRALLAEPRLAAATFLTARPGLRAAALEDAVTWPGVDRGWARELRRRSRGWTPGSAGEVATLRLVTDQRRDASLALWAFRRRPRPLEMAAIPVHAGWARQLALPPATTQPTTSAEAFGERGCEAPES